MVEDVDDASLIPHPGYRGRHFGKNERRISDSRQSDRPTLLRRDASDVRKPDRAAREIASKDIDRVRCLPDLCNSLIADDITAERGSRADRRTGGINPTAHETIHDRTGSRVHRRHGRRTEQCD